MTAYVIEPTNHGSARLVDGIYRLRHQVFKQSLDWDVECLHGREIDQFDTDDAVYGAVADEFGVLEGCFRLLPTTGPYMLSDIFPELLHGHPVPRDPRIMECSRFAVFPQPGRSGSIAELLRITAELLIIQLEYCLRHGIHTMVCATDLRFERILHGAGLVCERYGPPLRVGSTRAVAGFMHPNKDNLLSVRQRAEHLRETTNTPIPLPRQQPPLVHAATVPETRGILIPAE
jgi:acyl homoserine lactone synthase